ncbi:MAG TPA: hypothetical protein PKW41_12785 [Clostridia bacterium]|nr:hypothetical protein [Clostridia bacterium]HPK16866.1 hypothetical protein [Clostridia bacterium]
MDTILHDGCLGVLLLLENEPEKYNSDQICSLVNNVDLYDIQYMLTKGFIQFDHDYIFRASHRGIDKEDKFALNTEGKAYLANYRRLKYIDTRWWITTLIALFALAASIISLFI